MTRVAAATSATLSIPADHPSLDGHFPGRPIVPGVVILDNVIEQARRLLAVDPVIRELAHAKFLRPLLPGESAQISLELRNADLHFRVTVDTAVVASGVFRLDRDALVRG